MAEFHTKNEKVMREYNALIGDYNSALETAAEAFQEHHEVLGDKHMGFSRTTKRNINVKLLVDLFPDAWAFVEPKLTCAEFDTHSHLIPEDVQEQVVEEQDVFKGPKKL